MRCCLVKGDLEQIGSKRFDGLGQRSVEDIHGLGILRTERWTSQFLSTPSE